MSSLHSGHPGHSHLGQASLNMDSQPAPLDTATLKSMNGLDSKSIGSKAQYLSCSEQLVDAEPKQMVSLRSTLPLQKHFG